MQPRDFIQEGPQLGNQYQDDRLLQSALRRLVPREVLDEIEPGLVELGELSGGELYRQQLDELDLEPLHVPFDPWGNRIDEIRLTPLWRRAEALAARFGVVAAAYERRFGAYDRLHQAALAYLFHPSTNFVGCPLAMTDGAARTLLASGERDLIERVVPRLTSRDPETFWTSGQWMTEAIGGSDVGVSETVARRGDDGQWRLYGKKWFCSAATAPMALTLARPEGNGPGGRGLALFYVERWLDGGQSNGIEVIRLKNKLGTKTLPTAELRLSGTIGRPLFGLDQGVRNITTLLNTTRYWNALSAAATMRRSVALARDYARRRVAFGSALAHKPLHQDVLAWMQAETEAAFHLAFFVAQLMGLEEAGAADEGDLALLRLLTPIAKLTTGKQAPAVASEAVECFAGVGYVEDSGVPLLLRDAQVLPIWEGTTNILSLDMLRAVAKTSGLEVLRERLRTWHEGLVDPSLVDASEQALQAVHRACVRLERAREEGVEAVEFGARRFALTLGRAVELALLCRQAQWSLDVEGDPRPRAAARRFALTPIDHIDEADPEDARLLATEACRDLAGAR